MPRRLVCEEEAILYCINCSVDELRPLSALQSGGA
jgi:hypothetical protein